MAHGFFPSGEDAQQRGQRAVISQASDQHVGEHVQAVDQVELLKNHGAARAPAQQLPAPQRTDVGAVEPDASGGGVDEPVDQPQQRGFARAGPADDAHHGARFDVQVDRIDRLDLAEVFAEIFQFEHMRRPPGACSRDSD
jgi:hypothetical protein